MPFKPIPLTLESMEKPKLSSEALATRGATAEDILRLAERFEVDSLRLQFTDITGINKNVEVPQSQFA